MDPVLGGSSRRNQIFIARRLKNGYVFRDLPAPHWGMEVARGFVHDEARHRALSDQLGLRRLSFYLNEVALFADIAAEPQTALEFYHVRRQEGDQENLSIVLRNLGDTELSLGLLAQAVGHFAEALDLAAKINDDEEKLTSLARGAYAASRRGDIEGADAGFSEANAIQNRINPDGDDLYSIRGIQWAEHLLRTGGHDRAHQLTGANRKVCTSQRWQQDIARCEWILGWLDTLAGRWPEARAQLNRANATFTAGHMIHELARVLLTEAACHLGERHCDSDSPPASARSSSPRRAATASSTPMR